MRIRTVSALIAVSWAFVSIGSSADGQCVPFKPEDRDAVISYVSKRFHVQQSLISIVRTEPVDESCFVAIHLHAINPSRSLLLYLSPDRRHLAPDLYDMSVDPLIVAQKEHLSVSRMLTSDDSPSRGSLGGAITIVEFSDFQCPYCKEMAETLSRIVGDKHSAADIDVVYKYFPLPMHDWAHEAATVAECTHKLDPAMFWNLHDFFFANQGTLKSGTIMEGSMGVLRQTGTVSETTLRACIESRGIQATVERSVQLGKKLGVTSTPTIFINGEKIEGAKSPAQMDEILERVRNEVAVTHAMGEPLN